MSHPWVEGWMCHACAIARTLELREWDLAEQVGVALRGELPDVGRMALAQPEAPCIPGTALDCKPQSAPDTHGHSTVTAQSVTRHRSAWLRRAICTRRAHGRSKMRAKWCKLRIMSKLAHAPDLLQSQHSPGHGHTHITQHNHSTVAAQSRLKQCRSCRTPPGTWRRRGRGRRAAASGGT